MVWSGQGGVIAWLGVGTCLRPLMFLVFNPDKGGSSSAKICLKFYQQRSRYSQSTDYLIKKFC